MTGWADDFIEEEDETEDGVGRSTSDGDILGDVKEAGGWNRNRGRRRSRYDEEMWYEEQWEIDSALFEPGKVGPTIFIIPTQFRQCAQAHTDWVNDILLCNYNQTVLSASSDGTVKSWNPHSAHVSEPSIIGGHLDYVRCLAHCREQNWVASGSFDRTIKIWDLTRTAVPPKPEPVVTLHPPDASGPKSSVYALAADPFGHAIASGSPERVVRMWDPRSGKRIAKLVGHTDNIRAIQISDDSRYLLTGSADASIKLWSLTSQRCLHTFTYHTDSVWSLFSSHPSLEVFYSGDRSGLVCRVDVEDCSDVSEGECVVLCQDTSERGMASADGINKIVAMDDQLLWTASGTSSIKRWRIPVRRSVRPSSGPRASLSPSVAGSYASALNQDHREVTGGDTLFGIPFESLVRLSSPNDPFTPFQGLGRGRDPEVATLYSAASVMSVPRALPSRTPLQAAFQQQQPHLASSVSMRTDTMNSRVVEDYALPVNSARADYEEREVAGDAIPLVTHPDDVVEGDHGLVRSIILNDRMHALTVDTAGQVAVWNIVKGVCLGKYAPEDVSAASFRGSTGDGSSVGGAAYSEQEHSPREALETVRERIEGEAVVMSWSAVDTKTGVLTVHLNDKCFEAEIYADEAGYGSERHFGDEARLNIGKWVLRNLFIGFIREEQRAAARRIREEHGYDPAHHRTLQRGAAPSFIDLNGYAGFVSRKSSMQDLSFSANSPYSVVLASPTMTPAISPHIPPSARASPLLTPLIQLHPITKESNLSPIPQSPTALAGSHEVTPMPRPLVSTVATAPPVSSSDYFSLRARGGSISSGRPTTPDENKTSHDNGVPQTPSTPGGFMGKLRHFGKSTKRASDVSTVSTPGGTLGPGDAPATPADLRSPVQALILGPLTPPSSSEAPPLPLPLHTSIVISEEASPGWRTLYRGTISSAGFDVHSLEESMPFWLLEFLLTNRVPPIPVTKLSFVLLPYPSRHPHEERLPELLNTAQSKLTASRFLRIRKIAYHVQDKLDRMAGNVGHTPRSSFESSKGRDSTSRARAEDQFEILCNDYVLPLDMTLAAVRQYVWRQTAELVMHYRRRTPHEDRHLLHPSAAAS
ncbi:hypothetical protein JAAARDRAFT_129692 [Jaapia argillacea MUCL 33604]|uniref:Uncharacterized protein n=1 Tax=Jaapia argillacea MUCL 33604 TaxID=933084 RepID=A0A067Q3J5_9AGAM|nr:hypothetical protein JAAARDRAFT_129692 [Jaapia argillacea MUCL 33604]